MATISTRVDDETKNEAEAIANEIGITLSTAISVFLKQFVANEGFPFNVIKPKFKSESIINVNELNRSIQTAISNSTNTYEAKRFSYLDTNTNQIVTINMEE